MFSCETTVITAPTAVTTTTIIRHDNNKTQHGMALGQKRGEMHYAALI